MRLDLEELKERSKMDSNRYLAEIIRKVAL